MNNDHLILYASCIPVKGFTRSVIYDLQRCIYIPIPNSLFELLHENEQKLNLQKIKKNLSQEDRETLKEYIDFLIGNDLAIFCSSPKIFIPMRVEWDTPSLVTNAAICLNEKNIEQLPRIVRQLDILGVQCVELRFIVDLTDKLLFKTLDVFDDSLIYALEILSTKKSDIKSIDNNSLFLKYPRITRVTLYGKQEYTKIKKNGVIYEFIDAPYKSDHCGVISHKSLIFSIPFFMEAQFNNVCLNKKMYIDEDGDIRNCPMSEKKYSNILSDNIDLKELAVSADFNVLAKIKKDDIEICKVCEFRYACPDCRVYKHNSLWSSAPAKCRYNPFIGKWHGQTGFIPVVELGEYDGNGKFILDENKLGTYQNS